MSDVGPDIAAVDAMFLERADTALAERGLTAIEALETYPRTPIVEVARQINSGISAIGLISAVYRDAEREGRVREVAKEMLLRQILWKYSGGWQTTGKVSHSVNLGDWSWHIRRNCDGGTSYECAAAIVRWISREDPLPDGWKPASVDDPILHDAFDQHWPVEPTLNDNH